MTVAVVDYRPMWPTMFAAGRLRRVLGAAGGAQADDDKRRNSRVECNFQRDSQGHRANVEQHHGQGGKLDHANSDADE